MLFQVNEQSARPESIVITLLHFTFPTDKVQSMRQQNAGNHVRSREARCHLPPALPSLLHHWPSFGRVMAVHGDQVRADCLLGVSEWAARSRRVPAVADAGDFCVP